jgi:YVTN family beta-propeller protein
MHLRTCLSAAGIAFFSTVEVVMNRFALFVGLFALVFSAGCGGGTASVPPPPPPAISVSLSEATATVQAGATAQFTASVANDSAGKGVTWTVTCSASACGSVSPTATPSGTPTTYTAPSTGASLTVTLTAISVVDGTKSASATITVAGPVPAMVSGTVAVGTAPDAIAVDSTTNKIYVADFGEEDNNGICSTCYRPVVNGTLTAIDGATQSPTIIGFSYAYSNPLDLAVNIANHTLYVASRVFFTISPTCGYSDNVAVLASATLTQTATTYVGSAHAGAQIAVNKNTGNVFVTDWYDGTVTVLDGGGNLLATITVGSHPTGVSVNATTNKIYVANSSSNDISVIDGATNSVTSTISSPEIIAPVTVTVNPTTNTIYVANGQSCFTCPNPNDLAVIDGASSAVAATIPVGNGPAAVAVDTQTNFIYVADAGNHDFNQHGSVTVINGATNATTTTLTDPNMPYPFRIAVNSTTNKIYVASILSNNITVIDGAHD